MKQLKSILLWTIGGLFFLPLALFTIICAIIFKPETYDSWVKAGFRFLLKIMFIKVEVEGAEKLDKNQSYIFMPNHVSLFDMPVLAGYIPNIMRAVEAEENFKIPVYGMLVRKAGNIPISRKNIHSSIKTIKVAFSNLKSGTSITLFPEGHRTLTGELGEFTKLPFFMAKEANIPIVPMGLSGLFSVKSKNTWMVEPGVVKVKFGDIISLDEMESMSTVELRNFVKEKVSGLVE